MVDFLFGKDMKKFLIAIFPLLAILFILLWISWGLEGVLAFFSAILFIIIVAVLFAKWIEFVDKHIKD